MKIRSIKLPEDFDILSEMILNSFQYPENPDWDIEEDEKKEFARTVKSFKKMWPLFNILGIFSKTVKNLLVGSIAEENNVPAGVIMYQQNGKTDKWEISTVGVLPKFRRRGIARKLVETGIEHIKELGGKIICLDVISGNLPAYTLYKEVGFEHYSGISEMQFNNERNTDVVELPEGVELIKTDQFDWQPRYDLFEKITPEDVKKYEPIEVGRFKQPIVMRIIVPIITFAQGIDRIYQLVSVNGEIVGRISINIKKKPGGKHFLSLYLNEKYAELCDVLSKYSINQINQLGELRGITSIASRWQPHVNEALIENGFEIKVEGHRLGLILEK